MKKLPRQLFVMSTLTMLPQFWQKMIYLPLLVGNMVPKMQKGDVEAQGEPLEIGILTTFCEMGVGGGGKGVTPVKHTYQWKNMCAYT